MSLPLDWHRVALHRMPTDDAVVGGLDRGVERSDQLRILHPRRALGPARDVDRERTDALHRLTHVRRGQATGEDERGALGALADELPGERLAAAAVEEVEVGVERLERRHVAARAHADRLDDLRAGPPRDLAAERRALVSVKLHHREPQDV